MVFMVFMLTAFTKLLKKMPWRISDSLRERSLTIVSALSFTSNKYCTEIIIQPSPLWSYIRLLLHYRAVALFSVLEMYILSPSRPWQTPTPTNLNWINRNEMHIIYFDAVHFCEYKSLTFVYCRSQLFTVCLCEIINELIQLNNDWINTSCPNALYSS